MTVLREEQPMQCSVKVASFIVIGVVATAQPASRTVWDGVYSAAQADRGNNLYAGACASCHGKSLEGGHIYGSRTRTAPALKGEAFLASWNGLPTGELFSRISKSMPLDRAGSLSDEENTDIVALILETNGFPAGSRDLPPDITAMNSIQIVSKKK
jgi:cytochrome c